MIAAWMLYAALLSAVLAGAAWVLERAALAAGRSARPAWALALAASLALPAGAAWRGARDRAPAAAIAARPNATPGAAGRAGLWDAALAALAAAPEAGPVRHRPSAPGAPAFAPPAGWGALDGPLLALWGAASVLLLARLGRQARRSRRAVARWPERLAAGGPVRVADDVGPAVVGALRPAVVIPAWALGDARLPLVLAHEREHVRARDPLLLAAASVACAVVPWSPALWWQRRRLRDAVEFDCDRRVLARAAAGQTLGTHPGAAVGAYGRLLLDVAARAPRAAVGLALTPRRASLRRRIHLMTAPRPPRFFVPACAAGAVLMAALAYGVPRPAAARVTAQVAAQRGPGTVVVARSRVDGAPLPEPTVGRPLTVVDGKTVGPVGPEVRRTTSRQMELVRPPESVARFGERGRNGALVYTTPAAYTTSAPPAPDTTGADTASRAGSGRYRAESRDSGRTFEITPVDAQGHPTGPAVLTRRPDQLTARADRPGLEVGVPHVRDSVLVIIDGREVGRGEAGLRGVQPDSIAEVDVFRGEPARARYGDRGRNGVVEITMKAGAAKAPASQAP